MLVHTMAECFNLASGNSSNNQTSSKYTLSTENRKKFDNKSHDNSKNRDITLIKTPETKIPILTLHDYFTEAQNMNHNQLFAIGIKSNDSSEIVNNYLNLAKKKENGII